MPSRVDDGSLIGDMPSSISVLQVRELIGATSLASQGRGAGALSLV